VALATVRDDALEVERARPSHADLVLLHRRPRRSIRPPEPHEDDPTIEARLKSVLALAPT